MDLGLTGRTAVVTGASRGIGLAITRGLAAHGAHVIAGARRSSAELDQLAKEGSVRVLEVDLTGPDGPARLVALASAGPDILVNNVGGAPARTGGFLSISDEEWQSSLTLNLMAAVRATRSALPAMLEAGKGSIVTVCSVNASLPDPAVLDYSAAKAALARSPPTCGSGIRGSRRLSAVPPAPSRRTSPARRRRAR
jgi:NAD(P)-dependent dehydrogenase (short-subunit alcohol dehydrogenase family)